MLINREFIEHGQVLVNKDVLTTRFTCDLGACKGACCTIKSDYGAPLHKAELPVIEQVLPIVLPRLPEQHRAVIERLGFYEELEGELLTRSYNQRACVFVYYEGDVAKCSIEKAYFEGLTPFRKPISCHLFPIRISNFGGDVVRYEKLQDCKPALAAGKTTGTRVIEFCKEGLERKYGAEWYAGVSAITNSLQD